MPEVKSIDEVVKLLGSLSEVERKFLDTFRAYPAPQRASRETVTKWTTAEWWMAWKVADASVVVIFCSDETVTARNFYDTEHYKGEDRMRVARVVFMRLIPQLHVYAGVVERLKKELGDLADRVKFDDEHIDVGTELYAIQEDGSIAWFCVGDGDRNKRIEFHSIENAATMMRQQLKNSPHVKETH